MAEKPDNFKKNPIMKKNTFFLNFFAWWVITCIFAYIALITWHKVPAENEAYVTFVLGSIFGSGFAMVMNWAFRTAKGALEEKNLAAQIKQLNGGGKDEPEV